MAPAAVQRSRSARATDRNGSEAVTTVTATPSTMRGLRSVATSFPPPCSTESDATSLVASALANSEYDIAGIVAGAGLRRSASRIAPPIAPIRARTGQYRKGPGRFERANAERKRQLRRSRRIGGEPPLFAAFSDDTERFGLFRRLGLGEPKHKSAGRWER